MKRAVSLFGVLFLLFGLCACKTEEKRSVTWLDVFDTVSEFVAYGGADADFQKAADAVHEELLRLHRLCDIYHPYEGVTNLYAVNERLSGETVELDPDLVRLLAAGKRFYKETGGKLNIGMGSVLSLWHAFLEGGEKPDGAALAEARRHTDLDTLSIEGGTVTLSDPGLKLDLGALAKGYAAEAVRTIADSFGFSGWSLNLGGNVLLRGAKPNGKWQIGVQDPDGGVYTVLALSDLSAVTSGDYQRCREYEGETFHHIIDPDTAAPARLYRSVTVLSADSFTADALSTSLFCLSREEGMRLAKAYGAEALWILEDGTSFATVGFSGYETKS